MYIPRVEVRKSAIDGKGVFALEPIFKNTIVWKYAPDHDLSFTQEEFDEMNEDQKKEMHHSAYLSPWSGLWICPPPEDPACYTNHSNANNTDVKFDANVSKEPYFVANKDIAIGEEITNNYYEFDKITQATKPAWAK